MKLERLDNGWLKIRREGEEDGNSLLANLMENFDFAFAVDEDGNEMYEYCIGNWECASNVIDMATGLEYMLYASEYLNKFVAGEEIVLEPLNK